MTSAILFTRLLISAASSLRKERVPMKIEWIDVRKQIPDFPLRLMWESDFEDALIFESEGVIASWDGCVWAATAKLKVPRSNCVYVRSDGVPVESFAVSCPLLWNAGEGDFSEVNHWMPLPKPPRDLPLFDQKEHGDERD